MSFCILSILHLLFQLGSFILTAMSKSMYSDEPLAAEDYELQPTSNVNDPLLPSYSQHPSASPHQQLQRERRATRLRSVVSRICIAFLVIIPTLAFAACYFGRTTLDKVRTWDNLPPEVQDWLDKIAPAKTHADHSNFPTE